MTDFPFAIVGFDLDGTLLETGRELAAAVNHALAGVDRPALSDDHIRTLIGSGTRKLMERALEATGGVNDELMAQTVPAMLARYEADLGSDSPPYPGMVDALDELSRRGVRLAVVTNKMERLAVALLERVELADRFDTIIGGDTMGKGKFKPDPAPLLEMVRRCGGGESTKTAFVGDSIADTTAARAANMPSVVVSFGFRRHELHELGGSAIIDHYDELIPALQAL